MKKLFLLTHLLFSYAFLFAQPDSLVKSSTPKDTVIFSDLSFKNFKQQAAFENKPYILMFSASWCAPCHRIKKELFTNAQIAHLANENYLAYFIDIESFDGSDINAVYKVTQLPTILFFDPKGKPIDKAIGYFDGYYIFKKLRAHVPPSMRGADWEEIVTE